MTKQYTITDGDATPDPEKAVAFLESIAGGHPVSVARIHPDGDLQGATFTVPDDRISLRDWIIRWEGKANLYYSLNAPALGEPRIGKAGKLAEADVAFVRGVAVDMDPRPGKPFAEERRRLLSTANKARDSIFGGPTAIVDSGGGYQMLWLFPEPVAKSDDFAHEVKAQARGLGGHFGSDPVQSLDHLFRLPWTTNLPNAKKRERGRKTATATVVCDSGARHSMDTLRCIAEPAEERENAAYTAPSDLDYSAVLETLAAPDDLPERLRPVALECAARLDEIAGDALGDRSTTDYRVAAHVIREHAVTDPTELARITFAASPDRLTEDESKGRGETYCARTIGKALAANRPNPRPEEFFAPVIASELVADDKVRDLFNEAPESKRPPIEILKRDDIRHLKPPQFVIGRHLPETSFGFLYGAPGSYKSFLALDWSLHIAYGRDNWHGDQIEAKPGGWVVYLAREGASGMRARIEAWEKQNVPAGTPECRFALVPSAIDLMDKSSVEAIIERIKADDVSPISMIVIDTVSRSMPGADENMQKDMTRFVAACDSLKDTFQCIVLGVHHTSKAGDMRGSSVLLGAGDFAFRASKQDAGDSARKVTLHCEKMKDGADAWHDDYWLDAVDLGLKDECGKAISSLVPRRALQVEKNEREARVAREWAEIVLRALGDRDEAPWADLTGAVGEMARAQGLIRGSSDQKVREPVTENLGGPGVDVTASNGQLVNLSITQTRDRGPYTVKKSILLENETNDENAYLEAAE